MSDWRRRPTSDEHRLAGCVGKQGFASPDLPKKIAKRSRRHGGQAVQVFRCQFCRQWHIGTSSDKR